MIKFISSMRLVAMTMLLSVSSYHTAYAANIQYAPGDVYSKIQYASGLAGLLLEEKGVTDLAVPVVHETAVDNMHMYELHVAVISELFKYSVNNDHTPPPLIFSSPIDYSINDVYQLSVMIVKTMEDIYRRDKSYIAFRFKLYLSKNSLEAYGVLSKLYYQLVRLNELDHVSDDQIYSQAYRAKEDLKIILLKLSKELDTEQADKKRLLVTAAYGMHPDGSMMSSFEEGKSLNEVVRQALVIRNQLNTLRQTHEKEPMAAPSLDQFSETSAEDVFLQTQFIIAEINLLKPALGIDESTSGTLKFSNKSTSDVYQEMKHISYLLDRLVKI